MLDFYPAECRYGKQGNNKGYRKYVKKNSGRAFFSVQSGAVKIFIINEESVVMVGNSSSGIIEAPSFKLPVVNIGSRQMGRIRAKI